jgi:hypothetical protein
MFSYGKLSEKFNSYYFIFHLSMLLTFPLLDNIPKIKETTNEVVLDKSFLSNKSLNTRISRPDYVFDLRA